MAIDRRFIVACAVALFAGLTGSPLNAGSDPYPIARTTYLTFSGAVALPGVTLPAGSYVFEIVDGLWRNDIVRVRAKATSKIYLTAFTRSVQRPRSLQQDQFVTFGEATPGVPRPITAWYPAGERTGHEFIY